MKYARVTAVAAATAAVLMVSACAHDGAPSSSGGSKSTGADGDLTVLAAASLTEVFTDLSEQYEKQHPGAHVKLSFAASSDIVTQLSHGAPADIVALADTRSADKLPADLRAKRWTPFATNRLEIATPKGNPAHVQTLNDLAKVDMVLCARQVPCGRAAAASLEKASVDARVVSYESNVKSTLAKVRSGDAQAAIVYATDVESAGDDVTGVEISARDNVLTTLPITMWRSGTAASSFETLVTGPTGRKALREHGFGAPPSTGP